MECTVSISDKKLEEFFGKEISAEEFANFCKDAIASKIFLRQFTDNQALQSSGDKAPPPDQLVVRKY